MSGLAAIKQEERVAAGPRPHANPHSKRHLAKHKQVVVIMCYLA